MSHRRIQIHLTPEQHRALETSARAAERSMTDIIGELIDRHIMIEGSPPTNLSDLAGAVKTGRRTDVAQERDSMLTDTAGGLR